MSNGTIAAESLESRLATAVDEFLAAARQGRPGIDEFADRYPDLADHLRQVLPALALFEPGALDPTDSPSPLNGTLGDFRLLREVGRGGMGIVYEAEQISLDRRVALKVLPYAATMDAKQLQRFRNEAKAAASLHHEHIVPVFAVGCERGVHYYAMQFIEGRTVAQMVADLHAPAAAPAAPVPAGATVAYTPAGASAPTPPVAALSTERSGPKGRDFYRTIAQLIAQAADALEHAHSLGIVHRDVKPGNLLVDESGKLWVADFGLARFGADAGLTVSGDLLGTLRYMAPEQAMSRHGLVDHRADIYGLGATLYELITGQPAVDGAERAAILRQVAFEEPKPPRKLDKAIPAELETITLKCLAKDPNERYATSAALADDLRRWLDHQTIKAKPPTLRQKAVKWAMRHTAVVRVAVAALAVSTVALAVSTYVVWTKETKAQASLRTARAAADVMLTKVADRLVDVPRMEGIRHELLQQAMCIYDGFLKDNGDNPAVRLEAGVAARKLGNIGQGLDGLEADQSYRQSITLLQALATDSPTDTNCQRELARSLYGLGSLLTGVGRHSESEPFYRDAARIQESLANGKSAAPQALAELAQTYGGLALVIARRSRVQEAEIMYRRALDLYGQLPPDVGSRRDVRLSFATVARNLGGMLGNRQERRQEADDLTRRALKIFEELLAEFPESGSCRSGMAICYHNLSVSTDPGPLREELARKSFDLSLQLVADFPQVVNYTNRLESATTLLSRILCADHRFDEASAVVRRVQDLWQGLFNRYPDKRFYIERLAACLHQLGRNLQAAGQLAEAEGCYRNLVALGEKLAADHPNRVNYRIQLQDTYHHLGDVLYYADRQGEAEQSYRQELRELEKLVAIVPAVAQHHSLLASLLSDCPVPQVRDASRAVAAAQRAAKLAPEDGLNWLRLGMAFYRAGDFSAAAEALRKALELHPKSDGNDWYYLASGKFFLAMTHWQMGIKGEARKCHAEAVKWIDENRRDDPDLRRHRAEADALLGRPDEPKANDK